MKILLHAFLGALLVHVLYFVALFAIGYVKTLTYRPNMALYWENTERLPQEVAFGTATSPTLYLATFLGVMLMWGILLFSYKKVGQSASLSDTEIRLALRPTKKEKPLK